ncbi:MAG: YadA-like family protein [Phascolarctobacterium sp.]|nr:YadA-like family protein [Phascolarctobacterium sp.]
MSKKMLKRSLALGALMAFVITGSAFAGVIVEHSDRPSNLGDNGIKVTATANISNMSMISKVEVVESVVDIGTKMNSHTRTVDERSVGIGWNVGAKEGSVAIGYGVDVQEKFGVAIGQSASTIAENSVAIGASSKATEENTVSFGSVNIKREIVNIAEGTTDYSAVNLGQMNNALAGKADAATTLSGYGITDAYTKTEVDTKLDAKADKTALDTETSERVAADQVLQAQIDNIGGDSTAAINGLNQRLGKLNGKINKVGAGAAALAALHPLEYDPDDKLTFSAGMGNYAGENAAALGAFYRPNEKFMVSLGGTMGNGENMVNLGLSIGLDKPNGLAKLSKRELIQKVNAVEAENDALEDRVAKLEALVAQLASK